MLPINSGRLYGSDQKVKHHMDNAQGINHLSSLLADCLMSVSSKSQLVIVCIGTDRSTGDCLGPLVGTKLQESLKGFTVYGNLNEPVHASNLEQTLFDLKKSHPSAYVIAVDACLGNLDSLGYISFCKGALKPGAGVHKTLPPVGDVHLTGIVNVGGFMEYLVLQNTRLSFVMKMADSITQIILTAYDSAQMGNKNRIRI